MAKKTTDDRASLPDEENPEWTKGDFTRARPAADVLPEFLGKNAATAFMRRSRGRPPKPDKKVNQTLRLDPDVLEAFRQEGGGWQARINEMLRENMPRRAEVDDCLNSQRINGQRNAIVRRRPTVRCQPSRKWSLGVRAIGLLLRA